MSKLIYSVEDDKNIAKIIRLTLSKQGYEVETFEDGTSFLDAINKRKPDLILLDLMLPDIDGNELIRKIRDNKFYDDVLIMIISARNNTLDKVDSLDLGADDFLEKPFDLLELISRVNAKFRRKKDSKIITIGNVSLDTDRLICYVNNNEVNITNAEFKILLTLMQRSDEAVSREELLKILWKTDQNVESRTIDVHINNIRQKLKKEGKRIVSVYGYGYRYLNDEKKNNH